MTTTMQDDGSYSIRFLFIPEENGESIALNFDLKNGSYGWRVAHDKQIILPSKASANDLYELSRAIEDIARGIEFKEKKRKNAHSLNLLRDSLTAKNAFGELILAIELKAKHEIFNAAMDAAFKNLLKFPM